MRASTVYPDTLFGPLLADRTPGRDAGRDHGEKCGLALAYRARVLACDGRAEHGTTTLFAALNIATSKIIGQCVPRHRSRRFLKFLRLIEALVPDDLDVYLVMDNCATQKSPAV